jgi:ankyrin repeat protein
MYAVRDGHVAVVQELLSRHARVDLQDNNGWKASQYGKKFPDVIRMLEESSLQKIGANV